MAAESIIIIGGGLAGLSTGCYAQMNGFNTRILEQHYRPGGLCTAWKRQGYTMDGCIHWLMSCQPGTSFRQMYDELGCLTGNRLLPVEEYCRFFDQSSRRSLLISSDVNRLREDMHALAPEDGKAIDEFIRCSKGLIGFDTGIPEPRELMNFKSSLRMLRQLRPIIKYAYKYNLPVREYAQRFKNPFLRDCLTNLFLPDMPTYFLFVLMAQLFGHQLGCIEGASQRFADAIADRYLQLGGEIIYKAGAEKIIVQNDRAVGVRLEDGRELLADLVVSAADGYTTIFDMLDGRYVDDQINRRFKEWPLFNPLVLISYGVDREFPGEYSTHFINLSRPLTIGSREVKNCYLRIFNYDPTLAPAGKTVLQVGLESDYDYWIELIKDEAAYMQAKDDLAAEVMTRVEDLYPGTANQVEVTNVATPYTFWYFTRNYRASYEGWMMTKEAFQTILPKTLPGLSNFYMAGQWVEPGGGIPPVLYSGRNVVRIICHREGRAFATSQPE